MKLSKRLFSLLLALAICLSFVPVRAALAAEVADEGWCGDPAENDGKNLSWTIDDEGTLTISGSGKMADYDDEWSVPWYRNYRAKITAAVIGDGVTSIGGAAFYDCDKLSSVTIAESVTSIGA